MRVVLLLLMVVCCNGCYGVGNGDGCNDGDCGIVCINGVGDSSEVVGVGINDQKI